MLGDSRSSWVSRARFDNPIVSGRRVRIKRGGNRQPRMSRVILDCNAIQLRAFVVGRVRDAHSVPL